MGTGSVTCNIRTCPEGNSPGNRAECACVILWAELFEDEQACTWWLKNDQRTAETSVSRKMSVAEPEEREVVISGQDRKLNSPEDGTCTCTRANIAFSLCLLPSRGHGAGHKRG